MQLRAVRPFRIGVVLVFIATSYVIWVSYTWLRGPLLTPAEIPNRPRLIAHAGGALNGLTYTNSLEALEHSYQVGLRCFEIDFNWTRDGQLVCVHDWDATYKKLFPGATDEIPSLQEFEQLAMLDGLTQQTLSSLMAWLSVKEDAVIVTDIKEDNLKALSFIGDRYPEQMHQIVPQVYTPDEIAPARALGFPNIILTVYRCPLNRREILRRLDHEELFAITVPQERLRRWGYAENLSRRFFVYTHTVNTKKEIVDSMAVGVDGFYTDSLQPSSITLP